MAPLEPWEKVLVNSAVFPTTVHGQIDCINCHGGVQVGDKEQAHYGITRNPSDEPEKFCGECHPDVVETSSTNLHANLAGYWKVLNERTAPENHPVIDEMFSNHCSSCHASCGECHVSQPNLVGGGFIDGHLFNKTPSMTRNCTACHGSRVGNEYLGKHEGIRADVHFREGRMKCTDCHTSHEMHGQFSDCSVCHTSPVDVSFEPPDHRYAGIQSPRCESCHSVVTIGDGIEMHEVHGADLSCQVCHSTVYTSCNGCHVEISDKTGAPFFRTETSYLGFFIGRNPLKSFDRPYDYVPLRHVPIATTSFQFYGDDLLPNYDALPTWVYATPHNTQRVTPQAESCNSCHGNPDYFLTIDKVLLDELSANQNVIVNIVPTEIITPTITIDSESEVESTP